MRFTGLASKFFCHAWLLISIALIGCDYVDDGYPLTTNPTRSRGSQERLPADGLLRAYFFDVGQGDAILMHGPDFTILVDAGRHNRNDVVGHLQAAGVQAIDLLIGTHPHADHIGQFPQVLANFPVREVWMSGDQHNSRTFERAIDAVLSSDAGYHEPRAGEVLEIGSARVEVISPRRVTGDLHEGCIGVRVSYGDIAFMLTGDIEEPIEQEIIRSGLPLQSQVLKLGHHGSRTSSSLPFLMEVRPLLAIYSAGVGNSYGHPHPEVLQRMRDYDVPTYGTDQDGTIVVLTDGQELQVQTGREMAVPSQPGNVTTVSLNTASPEELLQITHMTPDRVNQLLQLRPIQSWDQLSEIHGLGPVRITEIQQEGRARLE